MLHVLGVLKAGASAVDFVKGGGLEADLGTLELTAAKQALQNVKIAADPRAQLWSVLNHLETAEAGFAESCAKRDIVTTAVRGYARSVALSNLFFVRCIMSVCYIHLGEKQLCRQAIGKMKLMLTDEKETSFGELAGVLLHAFSGMMFVNVAVAKGEYVHTSELETHLKQLEEFAAINNV